ncbi:MAG TPA: 4-hydroxy-3-methylbut-2-enyl diphosphate reductase [Candidatus Wallbacteria bacterium]|nr:4-hydroxy-3-methylbut-2-enyl diphosphate reductase [Candidatus Wallbacteria bacterium]
MKIKIARTAGFCFGVKRAMDKVLNTSNRLRSAIYTDGPLIHNPQIVKALEQRKISVLDDAAAPGGGATVVIRAHGVSPARKAFLESRCAQVIDGTCPLVSKIQNIVKKEIEKGRYVLIIGEAGHPEVIGILGFASGMGAVINSEEEISRLTEEKEGNAGDKSKIAARFAGGVSVVAQSTQELEHFENLVSVLKLKFNDIKVFNTICNATRKRQEEAAQLAREVDLMVIVGGKNSGNTKRLAEVAQYSKTPAVLVETEEELNAEMFAGKHTVGITAGASTPNWMIRNVAQKIEEISYNSKPFPLRLLKKTVNFLIDSDIYIGICAFAMAYVASTLIAKTIHPFEAWLAALYIFSMHTLNRYIDRDASRYNSSSRNKIYHKFSKYIMAGGVLASLSVVALSLHFGVWLFLFYVLCSLAGVLYSINFVPVGFRPYVRYASLKNIPGSRDLFISTAWAVVLTFSPAVSGKWIFEWRLLFTFSIIFIMAFCRTITLDIKDIQGDSIVGKETIPTLIGSKYSVLLMKFLLLCASVITIVAVLVNEYEYYSLSLIANFAYMLVIINKFGKETNYYGNYIEGLIDFNFILAALFLLITKWTLILF